MCLWNHQCRCVPSRMLSSPQLQSFQPLIFSTRPSTMSTMAIFARSSGFLGFVLALALGLTLGSSASATFTDCCMPTNWTAEHTATAMWKFGTSQNATNAYGYVYRDGTNRRVAFVDEVLSTYSEDNLGGPSYVRIVLLFEAGVFYTIVNNETCVKANLSSHLWRSDCFGSKYNTTIVDKVSLGGTYEAAVSFSNYSNPGHFTLEEYELINPTACVLISAELLVINGDRTPVAILQQNFWNLEEKTPPEDAFELPDICSNQSSALPEHELRVLHPVMSRVLSS